MSPKEARVVESPSRQYEDARFSVEGMAAAQSGHDEIDLFELMETIWQGRLKIALVALLCILLGAAYAYTATQWFKTNIKISDGKAEALFDVNNSELIKLSPSEAVQKIRKKLISAENFKDFYLNSTIAQELLVPPVNISKERYAYSVFGGQFEEVVIKLKKGEEKPVDTFIEFNFTYPKDVNGAELLNTYLFWTDGLVKSELLASFDVSRDNQLLLNQRKMQKMLNEYSKDFQIKEIRSTESYKYKRIILQDELKALKVQLIKKNQQRVLVLEENIAIAKKLGYKKPTSPTDVKELKDVRPVGAAGVEINNGEYSWLDKLPLYYRGYESLQAERTELNKRQLNKFPSASIVDMEKKLALLEGDREIEKLQNREKPEAFINDYVALEKRNTHLNSLEISVDNIELYELNARAVASQASIKPKKLLILVLAAFVGLMMGTLLVLIQGVSKKREATA